MSNNFGNFFFLTQNIFSKTREQFNLFRVKIIFKPVYLDDLAGSCIIFSFDCLRVQMHTPFNKEFSLLKTNTHSFLFEIY